MHIYTKYNQNSIWKLLLISFMFLAFLNVENAEASLGIDKNITQVKYPDSPTIYYLNHAQKIKKAYLNKAVFLSYGGNINDVKTISAEYLDKWKDAVLVKVKNHSTVYIIRDGKKKAIKSEAELYNLGYKKSDVTIVNSFELSQYRDSNNLELNTNQNGFSVKLDSAKSDSLVLGSAHNLVGVIKVKSLSGEKKINTVQLSLRGLYNANLISKITLENTDGKVIAEKNNINDTNLVFALVNNAVIAGENETYIKVYMDFNSCTNCANNTLFLELSNSNLFGSDNFATVGNFPIKTNTYRLANGGGYLGELNVSEESLDIYNGEIKTDGNNYILGRFTLKEASGREGVMVEQLIFVNNGTLKSANFLNLKIKENNKVIAQNPTISGKEITFKPNYFKIGKNSSKTIIVFGGVLDGTGRSIDLQLKKVVASGLNYNVGVKGSNTNIAESTKIVDRSLTVNPANTNPSVMTLSNVSNGTIISSFNLKASTKDLEVSSIGFDVIKGGNAQSLGNLYVVDHKTGDVIERFGTADGHHVVNIDKKMDGLNKSMNISFVSKMPTMQVGDYYQIVITDVVYSIGSGKNLTNTSVVNGEKYEFRNNGSSVVIDENPPDNNLDFVLQWPVYGAINYKFHDPNYIFDTLHQGVDIDASQGTNVRSAQSGTVITVVNGGMESYSYVVIDHGNGFKTVYGHLSQINAMVGSQVNTSTIIGKSGGTPGTSGAGSNTNGPHLHFEVIKDGAYVDPELYLQ